jgi:hypothetical protein
MRAGCDLGLPVSEAPIDLLVYVCTSSYRGRDTGRPLSDINFP